jgi:hypothetical protein
MKPKQCKCIKKGQERINLNLGGKTRLNDIMEMGDQALVGRFIFKRMRNE